jgi:holo-[acyl-carrier protein] synthase
MLIGIGTDIVSVARINRALKRWGERFKRRIFTEQEIKYCESRRNPSPHYAVRFSAKEAFYKALGPYQRSGIRWKEIEISRGLNGRPAIKVYGVMEKSLALSNFKNVLLTMTHDNDIASALVVIEG